MVSLSFAMGGNLRIPMHRGFIKVYRKIEDWEWFGDPNTMLLFFHLLIMANIVDKKWQGKIIKRGDLITSVSSLKKRTGISIRSIRTALDKLKSTNELTIKTTSNYTYISIHNYNNYNEVTNQTTNDRQTTDKRPTTTKEYKNVRIEEKNKNPIISNDIFFSPFKSELDTTTMEKAKKFDVRPKDIAYCANVAHEWTRGHDKKTDTNEGWDSFFNTWILRSLRRHEIATLSSKEESKPKPKTNSEDEFIKKMYREGRIK